MSQTHQLNSTAIKVLGALSEGPRTGRDLFEEMDVDQETLIHSLEQLMEIEYVGSEEELTKFGFRDQEFFLVPSSIDSILEAIQSAAE